MSLFVGNISSSTSKKALISHFEQFGKCEIEYYRRFAYINYSKESDGKNALSACNNQELDGNKLKVEFSQRKPVNHSPPSDKEQTTDKTKLSIDPEIDKSCPGPPQEAVEIPAIFQDSSQIQIQNPPNAQTRVESSEKNEDFKEESFDRVGGKEYLMREVVGESKEKSEGVGKYCKDEIDEVQSDKDQAEGVEGSEVYDSGEIILTVSIDEPSKFEETKMDIVVEDSGNKGEHAEGLKGLGGEDQGKVEVVQSGEVNNRMEVDKDDKELGKTLCEDVNEGGKKGKESEKSSKNSSPVSKLSQIKQVVPFNDPLTVQEPEPEKVKPSFLMSMGRKKIEVKNEVVVSESLLKNLNETDRTEKMPRKIQKLEENKEKVVKNEECSKKSSEKKEMGGRKTRKGSEIQTNTKKEMEKIEDTDKTTVSEVKEKDSKKTGKPTRSLPDVQEKEIVLPKLEEIKNLPKQRHSRTSPKDADSALPKPILPPPASKETKKTTKDPQITQIPTTKQPSPTKQNPDSSIPLNALKFDYDTLDEKTILVRETAFEVKKQLKDFSNSLIRCKTCNKEIKAKSAESHLNSKFHKDSS